jgi:hypothetical protein
VNIEWALLVEGLAAQLYTLDGGPWRWNMIQDRDKRRWRAAAKGCLRRGIRTGFANRRITPKMVKE